MIEIKNVSIKYVENFFSIYDVNLKIEKNTLLIGERLDGSFALMQTISKIHKKYSGTILIDDIDIKKISNKNLNLAYLPPQPVLFRGKTAKQNILYPLHIRKLPKTIQQQRFDELMQKFKIDFIDVKAKNLTPSQAKIVALLRAFIRQAKIVLIEHFFEDLDEQYFDLASKIITEMSTCCLIIASADKPYECFKNFEQIRLENGSIAQKNG